MKVNFDELIWTLKLKKDSVNLKIDQEKLQILIAGRIE